MQAFVQYAKEKLGFTEKDEKDIPTQLMLSTVCTNNFDMLLWFEERSYTVFTNEALTWGCCAAIFYKDDKTFEHLVTKHAIKFVSSASNNPYQLLIDFPNDNILNIITSKYPYPSSDHFWHPGFLWMAIDANQKIVAERFIEKRLPGPTGLVEYVLRQKTEEYFGVFKKMIEAGCYPWDARQCMRIAKEKGEGRDAVEFLHEFAARSKGEGKIIEFEEKEVVVAVVQPKQTKKAMRYAKLKQMIESVIEQLQVTDEEEEEDD